MLMATTSSLNPRPFHFLYFPTLVHAHLYRIAQTLYNACRHLSVLHKFHRVPLEYIPLHRPCIPNALNATFRPPHGFLLFHRRHIRQRVQTQIECISTIAKFDFQTNSTLRMHRPFADDSCTDWWADELCSFRMLHPKWRPFICSQKIN